MLLESKLIALRALEPKDIDLLYSWENDTKFWEVSHTQTPFSRYLLEKYLETVHLDIYTTKQLRLVIENTAKSPIGLLDLFDFEPFHKRAGVGILVHNDFQNLGYASEALRLLRNYAKKNLGLHQLYANIQEKNTKSLALFEKQGFEIIGLKKDWIKTVDGWENEITLQCIL